MSRTILVHLNVEVPDLPQGHDPEAAAREVADMILAAIEVGSDSDEFRRVMDAPFERGDLASGNGSSIVCTLAEQV